MISSAEAQKISKQEHAYKVIKDMIIMNKLPANIMLVEDTLSSMLNISRTPIRGALNSLVKEHLVTFYPGRGMFVSEVRIENVIDIYEIRELLDPLALKLYMQKNADSSFDELQSHVAEMKNSLSNKDYTNFYSHDFAFHTHYINNTGNDHLGRILNMFIDHTKRFFNLSYMDFENHERSYNDHMKILNAVKASNPIEAQKVLRQHLVKTKEYHIKNLTHN